MSFDLTDERFGRLTVIERNGWKGNKERAWSCRCDCGVEVTVSGMVLRSGRSTSCGCLKRELAGVPNISHGQTRDRAWSLAYRSWASMKTRCMNPDAQNFKYYGGRGITVCDEWLTFANFYVDMGDRPEGTTLDRIDPDGDYEPGNCRWADKLTQARNKRKVA
jgi:hypothetical protein